MNDSLTDKKTDLDSKLREPEVYYTMGLLAESLRAYERVLSDNLELDAYKQIRIREKIGALKKEIKDQKGDDVVKPSEPPIEEPSVNKEVMTSRENISEILDSASAFKKLSLFKEAVDKYEKLLESDYPLAKAFPDLSECLFSIHSPSAVIEHIETIINKNNINEKKAAQIKFMLGLEMEKREHHNLSLDLYKSAMEMDPQHIEIKSKIDAIILNDSLQSETDTPDIPCEGPQEMIVEDRIAPEMIDLDAPLEDDLPSEEIEMDFDLISDTSLDVEEAEIETRLERTTKTELDLEDGFNTEVDLEGDGAQKTEEDEGARIKADIEFDMETGIELDADQEVEEEKDEGAAIDPEVKADSETERYEDGFDEASDRVIELMDQILVDAYQKEVSHIHIEPSFDSQSACIRFRMDGVCQDYLELPYSMAREILRRLKMTANLNVEENEMPQDGKMKFKCKSIPALDLRLTTLPTIGEVEDAVIQILLKADAMVLHEIGLSEMNLNIMQRILAKPYGLMLVVGPDRSGKTTSLHSALAHIKKPGLKIWTVEDPVEIVQTGLRQVEAQPGIGLDLRRIMQSVLSADGDVIMIGEMQEDGTASMAIQASMTGHLVFSALRAEGASETVPMLFSMGLNPLNLSRVLLGILAQRLVRKLCPHCREAYHPSRDDFEEIVSDYGNGKFETLKAEFNPELTLYRPVGCDECSHSGYKGRIGIHELMEGTPQIKRLIKERAAEADLFEQAIKDGMTPMKQDGINKVFNGLTDIDEVRRVCVV